MRPARERSLNLQLRMWEKLFLHNDLIVLGYIVRRFWGISCDIARSRGVQVATDHEPFSLPAIFKDRTKIRFYFGGHLRKLAMHYNNIGHINGIRSSWLGRFYNEVQCCVYIFNTFNYWRLRLRARWNLELSLSVWPKNCSSPPFLVR